MNEDKNVNLIAAILALSEGLDASYEVMRKTLSYNAELQENKILERFIPQPIIDTKNRFHTWKKEIEKSNSNNA